MIEGASERKREIDKKKRGAHLHLHATAQRIGGPHRKEHTHQPHAIVAIAAAIAAVVAAVVERERERA